MTCRRSPYGVRGPHNRTPPAGTPPRRCPPPHRRTPSALKAGDRPPADGLSGRWRLASRQSANTSPADPETSHKPADQPASRPTTCQWSNTRQHQPPNRHNHHPPGRNPPPESLLRTEGQEVVAAHATPAGHPRLDPPRSAWYLPVVGYTAPPKAAPHPDQHHHAAEREPPALMPRATTGTASKTTNPSHIRKDHLRLGLWRTTSDDGSANRSG